MARVGKIARLPEDIRAALNLRLRNGESGPMILPWLNALPAVQAVLAEHFRGQEINATNLSDWRHGGFEDWEERQARTWRTKELAAYAVQLASANSTSIAQGAAAIASGRLLEVLEAAAAGDDSKKLSLEDLKEIVGSLTALRSSEIAQQRADADQVKLRQKDDELKLAREKFQRDTAELVLKHARDESVQRIAAAPLDHSAQLEAVGKHLFGDLWK